MPQNSILKISPKIYLLFFAILFISAASAFRILSRYESIFYDFAFKVRPPEVASDDIVIVEIADDTLSNFGKWPLPRDLHASLVDVLREEGARAVVFDLLFSEPSASDSVFTESMRKAGNVYLAQAFELYIGKRGFPLSREVAAGVTEGLREGAVGIGHINMLVDDDGKVRRAPLFINYRGQLQPLLGFKVACEKLGVNYKKVNFKDGLLQLGGKLFLPVTGSGELLVDFPGKWAQTFRHFSYFQILKAYNDKAGGRQPEIDLSLLKGKTCFVGLTATGTSDLRANPLENSYPMTGLQASVYNSVIGGKFIQEAGVFYNTLFSLIVFGLAVWLCFNLSTLQSFFGILILSLSCWLLVLTAFLSHGIWMDIVLPQSAVGLSYIGSILYRILEETRKRQMLEKELEIARQIQKSFLPDENISYPGLSIFPFMQPAKFVAGDFYDIIPIDETHTGLIIGDVAGKGASAALLMAQTISLFRIFARQSLDSAQVLNKLNQELCGRLDGRFVTLTYIIIDSKEKKISASSAGHPPLLICRRGSKAIIDAQVPSEMPIGLSQEVIYQSNVIDLNDNDLAVIFTDGISEARNKKGLEFGEERLKTVMFKNALSGAQGLAKAIEKEVFNFCGTAVQYDDLTFAVFALKAQ